MWNHFFKRLIQLSSFSFLFVFSHLQIFFLLKSPAKIATVLLCQSFSGFPFNTLKPFLSTDQVFPAKRPSYDIWQKKTESYTKIEMIDRLQEGSTTRRLSAEKRLSFCALSTLLRCYTSFICCSEAYVLWLPRRFISHPLVASQTVVSVINRALRLTTDDLSGACAWLGGRIFGKNNWTPTIVEPGLVTF